MHHQEFAHFKFDRQKYMINLKGAITGIIVTKLFRKVLKIQLPLKIRYTHWLDKRIAYYNTYFVSLQFCRRHAEEYESSHQEVG